LGFGAEPEIANAQPLPASGAKAQTVNIQAENQLKAKSDKVTIYAGGSKTVKLTYNDKTLSGSKATWSTSNASVATVKNGEIKAKKIGSATITAKYKGEEVKIGVTVTDGILEASLGKLTLIEGNDKTVKLTYNDKSLNGSKATWSTSDASVATVKNGVIKAKRIGTAVITAHYKGKEVKIEVTVIDGILEASPDKITIREGSDQTVKLKYNHKSLSGSKATWHSSNDAAATVKNGVIQAKAPGNTIVTALYKGKEVKIEVTVTSSVLEANYSSVTLKKGKEKTIKLTYNDKTASSSKAIWTSSDPSVASVKNGVIKAKAKGTATVIAKYKGKEVQVKVTVE
jgi:uncharacterized protein YjdB